MNPLKPSSNNQNHLIFSDDVCLSILSFLDPTFSSSNLWNYATISNQFMNIIRNELKLSLSFQHFKKIELMRTSRLSQNVTSLSIEKVVDFTKFCQVLKGMKNLTRLEMNRTLYIKEMELAQLKQLVSLKLNYNGINNLGARHLSNGMKQLTHLNIKHNDIGYEGIEFIRNQLNKLTSLAITINKNNNVINSIKLFKKITMLDIGNSSINDSGMKLLGDLTCLTRLNVEGNEIGPRGASIISQFKQLTSLSISNNSILSEGAQFLSQNLKLTELDLSNCGIGLLGVKSISSQLKELKSLDISFNQIGDAGVITLCELKNLTCLNVFWNEIESKGAECIGRELKCLTSLNIGENDIGDEGAKALSWIDRFSGCGFVVVEE